MYIYNTAASAAASAAAAVLLALLSRQVFRVMSWCFDALRIGRWPTAGPSGEPLVGVGCKIFPT